MNHSAVLATRKPSKPKKTTTNQHKHRQDSTAYNQQKISEGHPSLIFIGKFLYVDKVEQNLVFTFRIAREGESDKENINSTEYQHQ